MSRFAYTARDPAGSPVSGTIDAPGRRDALRLLGTRGLKITSLNEAGGGRAAAGPNGKSPKTGKGLSFLSRGRGAAKPVRGDRLQFLESLYDLLSSGMSGGESVRLLSQRVQEPRLRTLCTGLWEKLSEGATLSRAMAEYPAVFDSATVNLIQAGEATGSLNETVARLIQHLQEQRELRQQLLAALAYPVFMIVVACGVIIFFLTFLLPRLEGLLASLGGKLPTSTQILVNIANFATQYGIFVLIALAVFGIMFWQWRDTESGRVATDRLALRLPLIGPFTNARTVLAFSQNLSVLLENGITTAEALRMTERQIGNRVHRESFSEATDRVLEGEALSQALLRTKCFPSLVLDRLAVGENTGNVVPSLKDIAKHYQKQITGQLNVFTKVIASAVLLCVFVFVGFIAFAIVSAVFQLSSSFNS